MNEKSDQLEDLFEEIKESERSFESGFKNELKNNMHAFRMPNLDIPNIPKMIMPEHNLSQDDRLSDKKGDYSPVEIRRNEKVNHEAKNGRKLEINLEKCGNLNLKNINDDMYSGVNSHKKNSFSILDAQNHNIFETSQTEKGKSVRLLLISILEVSPSKLKIRELLDHPVTSIIMLVLTLIALFGDDFRLAFFKKNADLEFDILFIICFFSFFIEIILQFIAKKEYTFFSFYFCLDLIAVISIIPDIYLLTDLSSTGDT